MAAKQQNNTELISIEALKQKYKTPEVTFCGACARRHWRAGQQIAEGDYVKAVEEFLKAPLGRSAT